MPTKVEWLDVVPIEASNLLVAFHQGSEVFFYELSPDQARQLKSEIEHWLAA